MSENNYLLSDGEDSDPEMKNVREEIDRDTFTFEIEGEQYVFYIYCPGKVELTIKNKIHQPRFLFDKVGERGWDFCFVHDQIYQIVGNTPVISRYPPSTGWTGVSQNTILALEKLNQEIKDR